MGTQIYKEMFARWQALTPGLNLFVKVKGPVFYEFATDSNEISHNYIDESINWHEKSRNCVTSVRCITCRLD